jgi:hypothetical protein
MQDVPGHYIGPFSWIWNQTEMISEQAEQTGLLSGLLFMIMGSAWSGWLLADGCPDAIEFWEGNLLFY